VTLLMVAKATDKRTLVTDLGGGCFTAGASRALWLLRVRRARQTDRQTDDNDKCTFLLHLATACNMLFLVTTVSGHGCFCTPCCGKKFCLLSWNFQTRQTTSLRWCREVCWVAAPYSGMRGKVYCALAT